MMYVVVPLKITMNGNNVLMFAKNIFTGNHIDIQVFAVLEAAGWCHQRGPQFTPCAVSNIFQLKHDKKLIPPKGAALYDPDL